MDYYEEPEPYNRAAEDWRKACESARRQAADNLLNCQQQQARAEAAERDLATERAAREQAEKRCRQLEESTACFEQSSALALKDAQQAERERDTALARVNELEAELVRVNRGAHNESAFREAAETALASARELVSKASFAHIPRECRELNIQRSSWLTSHPAPAAAPCAEPEKGPCKP